MYFQMSNAKSLTNIYIYSHLHAHDQDNEYCQTLKSPNYFLCPLMIKFLPHLSLSITAMIFIVNSLPFPEYYLESESYTNYKGEYFVQCIFYSRVQCCGNHAYCCMYYQFILIVADQCQVVLSTAVGLSTTWLIDIFQKFW